MSCFGGRMKEYGLVSLDRFDGKNIGSTVYFLSHLHEDHTGGLAEPLMYKRLKSNKNIFLYCSEVTEVLLCASKKYRHLAPYIKSLAINTPTQIEIPDHLYEHNESVVVTLLPAFHCPGSVMFLLEGREGTVLYTGDFRWEHFDIEQMYHLRSGEGVKKIKSLYIDTTFCTPENLHIPSRQQCIDAVYQLVKEWTAQSPRNVVYIYLRAQYGHEPLLNAVASRLGKKVHVNDYKYEVYESIKELSGNFTADGLSTQIHACNRTCMVEIDGEMVGCKTRHDANNILVILPTTMYFTQFHNLSLDKIIKCVDVNFYRACYSFHSSYTEVRDLIAYLKPDAVMPNVKPPNDSTLAVVQHRLNTMLKECKAADNGSGETTAAAEVMETQELGTLKTRGRRGQKRKSKAESVSESESLDFGSPVKQLKSQTPEPTEGVASVRRGRSQGQGKGKKEAEPVSASQSATSPRRSSRRMAAASPEVNASFTQITPRKKGSDERTPSPDLFTTPVKSEPSDVTDLHSSYSGSLRSESDMDLTCSQKSANANAGAEVPSWADGSFLAAISSSSLEDPDRVWLEDDEEQMDEHYEDISQVENMSDNEEGTALTLDDINSMVADDEEAEIAEQAKPKAGRSPRKGRGKGRKKGVTTLQNKGAAVKEAGEDSHIEGEEKVDEKVKYKIDKLEGSEASESMTESKQTELVETESATKQTEQVKTEHRETQLVETETATKQIESDETGTKAEDVGSKVHQIEEVINKTTQNQTEQSEAPDIETEAEGDDGNLNVETHKAINKIPQSDVKGNGRSEENIDLEKPVLQISEIGTNESEVVINESQVGTNETNVEINKSEVETIESEKFQSQENVPSIDLEKDSNSSEMLIAVACPNTSAEQVIDLDCLTDHSQENDSIELIETENNSQENDSIELIETENNSQANDSIELIETDNSQANDCIDLIETDNNDTTSDEDTVQITIDIPKGTRPLKEEEKGISKSEPNNKTPGDQDVLVATAIEPSWEDSKPHKNEEKATSNTESNKETTAVPEDDDRSSVNDENALWECVDSVGNEDDQADDIDEAILYSDDESPAEKEMKSTGNKRKVDEQVESIDKGKKREDKPAPPVVLIIDSDSDSSDTEMEIDIHFEQADGQLKDKDDDDDLTQEPSQYNAHSEDLFDSTLEEVEAESQELEVKRLKFTRSNSFELTTDGDKGSEAKDKPGFGVGEDTTQKANPQDPNKAESVEKLDCTNEAPQTSNNDKKTEVAVKKEKDDIVQDEVSEDTKMDVSEIKQEDVDEKTDKSANTTGAEGDGCVAEKGESEPAKVVDDDVYEVVDLTGDDLVNFEGENHPAKGGKKKIKISFGKSKDQILSEQRTKEEVKKRRKEINQEVEADGSDDADDEEDDSDNRRRLRQIQEISSSPEWLSAERGAGTSAGRGKSKKTRRKSYLQSVNQSSEDSVTGKYPQASEVNSEGLKDTMDPEREEIKRQAMGFVCETDSESDLESSEPDSPTGSVLYDDYVELISDNSDNDDGTADGAASSSRRKSKGKDGSGHSTIGGQTGSATNGWLNTSRHNRGPSDGLDEAEGHAGCADETTEPGNEEVQTGMMVQPDEHEKVVQQDADPEIDAAAPGFDGQSTDEVQNTTEPEYVLSIETVYPGQPTPPGLEDIPKLPTISFSPDPEPDQTSQPSSESSETMATETLKGTPDITDSTTDLSESTPENSMSIEVTVNPEATLPSGMDVGELSAAELKETAVDDTKLETEKVDSDVEIIADDDDEGGKDKHEDKKEGSPEKDSVSEEFHKSFFNFSDKPSQTYDNVMEKYKKVKKRVYRNRQHSEIEEREAERARESERRSSYGDRHGSSYRESDRFSSSSRRNEEGRRYQKPVIDTRPPEFKVPDIQSSSKSKKKRSRFTDTKGTDASQPPYSSQQLSYTQQPAVSTQSQSYNQGHDPNSQGFGTYNQAYAMTSQGYNTMSQANSLGNVTQQIWNQAQYCGTNPNLVQQQQFPPAMYQAQQATSDVANLKATILAVTGLVVTTAPDSSTQPSVTNMLGTSFQYMNTDTNTSPSFMSSPVASTMVNEKQGESLPELMNKLDQVKKLMETVDSVKRQNTRRHSEEDEYERFRVKPPAPGEDHYAEYDRDREYHSRPPPAIPYYEEDPYDPRPNDRLPGRGHRDDGYGPPYPEDKWEHPARLHRDHRDEEYDDWATGHNRYPDDYGPEYDDYAIPPGSHNRGPPAPHGHRPPTRGPPIRGARPPIHGQRPPTPGVMRGPRPPMSGNRPPMSGNRPPIHGARPSTRNTRPPTRGHRPPHAHNRQTHHYDQQTGFGENEQYWEESAYSQGKQEYSQYNTQDAEYSQYKPQEAEYSQYGHTDSYTAPHDLQGQATLPHHHQTQGYENTSMYAAGGNATQQQQSQNVRKRKIIYPQRTLKTTVLSRSRKVLSQTDGQEFDQPHFESNVQTGATSSMGADQPVFTTGVYHINKKNRK